MELNYYFVNNILITYYIFVKFISLILTYKCLNNENFYERNLLMRKLQKSRTLTTLYVVIFPISWYFINYYFCIIIQQQIVSILILVTFLFTFFVSTFDFTIDSLMYVGYKKEEDDVFIISKKGNEIVEEIEKEYNGMSRGEIIDELIKRYGS